MDGETTRAGREREKDGDGAVSPMTAQNAYQSHETPAAPEEGVLTGAQPSQAGRHDPKRETPAG